MAARHRRIPTPASRLRTCCRGEQPFLDALDPREPGSRRASRARAGGRECRAGRARRHQLQRRRSERFGVDDRARDLGRLLRRLPHQRARLLGQRHRRRGRDDAARLCLAQRAASRGSRPRRGDRPQSRRARGRAAQPDAPEARPISGAVRPARLVEPARPFRRRDQRLGDRAQDELPPGQARRPGVRQRRDDRRRSAAAARPALAPVRRRGRAGLAPGAGLERQCSTSWIAESASARQLGIAADRPRGARRRRRSGRKPEQPLHGAGHAQPRRVARRLSRGGAGHRADRPGREPGDRRLQPRRGRASWCAAARSPSRWPRSPSPRT